MELATYTNFDHSYSCNPKEIYHPTSLDEIIKIVKNNANSKIRVVGSHHTFNDLSMTNDILIKMDKLKRILNVDTAKKLVTVEAGIILYDFLTKLASYGLALPVIPAISCQSIVGAISTGTHDSRTTYGTMASLVESMTLVTANGDVLKVDKDNEIFPALTVSLGACGIIYSVTLKCEKLFGLKMKTYEMSWDDFILSERKFFGQYEFIHAYLHLNNKMCELITGTKEKLKTDGSNVYYKMISSSHTDGYSEIELSFPYEVLNNVVQDLFNMPRNKIDDAVLIRFSGIDKDSFISMTSDRKSNTHISLFANSNLSKDPAMLREFSTYEDIGFFHNGRPHYGKKHTLTREKMIKLYRHFNKFLEIRNRLDPKRQFINEHLSRVLGD